MTVNKALWGTLLIGLAVVLAAPAMAIDWSASGNIYIGTAYYKNIIHDAGVPQPTSAAWNEENAWVQTRARLKITVRANEDLYGVVYFEIDSKRWGDAGATSDLSTLTPGTVGGAAGSGRGGAWGTDQIALEVKHVYIDFRVPPKLPVWIRAGIQRLKIRDNVFMGRDGAGITARILIDPIKLSITPMYFKRLEGLDHTDADDRDIYALDANLPAGPVKVGSYFLWDEARQWPTSADDGHLWWWGAYSDGKIGPLNYNFDFSYNGGSIEYAASPDVDYKGWMMRVVATYALNRFTFGAGGWYGSGDDVNTNDYEGFALPEGRSEAPGAANDDILILMGEWFGTGCMSTAPSFVGSNGRYGGTSAPATGSQFGGFWYVRGFAEYTLFDWLKLGAQVAYIGDTTEHGDTFGTARKAPFGSTNLKDHSEIGWEFDIGANIKIYKNLTYNLAFGYLIAGSALDQWDAGSSTNTDPQDPWAFITRLAYIF